MNKLELLCKTFSVSSDYRSDNVTPRKQLSCITHESDDDGYSSLKSSNREFSLSNSSLHSETFEAVAEYNFEQNNQRLVLLNLIHIIQTVAVLSF